MAAVSIADALFSRTRKAVIGLLFAQPGQAVHLRELARMAGVSPSMMAKEMELMLRAGLVEERRDGNRRLFQANRSSPVFPELAGLARKTTGVADALREALAAVQGIELAFVFGSVARGEDTAASDVDLFVVGECEYGELLQACQLAAQALGRPVNPVLYTAAELAERVREGNPFIEDVRRHARISLTGRDDDIARALGESRQDRPAAPA
jgi:predicted nucleotidyltransferase